MRRYRLLLFQIVMIVLASGGIYSCNKKRDTSCDNPASKGRIIGYDPCRHYSAATSKVQGLGFVIEIDNGALKDTVVTYEIPDGLFQFPAINMYATISGQFLYAPGIHENFLIKFNYKVAMDFEKTPVICTHNILTIPFERAVKGKEILISCVSKQ